MDEHGIGPKRWVIEGMSVITHELMIPTAATVPFQIVLWGRLRPEGGKHIRIQAELELRGALPLAVMLPEDSTKRYRLIVEEME